MAYSLLPCGLRFDESMQRRASKTNRLESNCSTTTVRKGCSRYRRRNRYNESQITGVWSFSKIGMVTLLQLLLFSHAEAFMTADTRRRPGLRPVSTSPSAVKIRNLIFPEFLPYLRPPSWYSKQSTSERTRRQYSTSTFHLAHVTGSTEYDRYRTNHDTAQNMIGKDTVSEPVNATEPFADMALAKLQKTKLIKSPIRHVAFICDGNSRWSKRKNFPTAVGHREGADRLVELIETITKDHPEIHFCTFYGFSTENWKRPSHEIQELFSIMEQASRRFIPRLLREMSKASSSRSIQIRILGDFEDERIPLGLQQALVELENITNRQERMNETLLDREGSIDGPSKDLKSFQQPTPLTVCLAINYGGRQDILQASRKIAAMLASGALEEDQVTEDTLASFLTTAGLPDPDMVVRTSGEHRLSNFLLWNSAYSELYLTDVLWPDFDALRWREAVDWYKQRKRRFGSRSSATGEAHNTSQEK